MRAQWSIIKLYRAIIKIENIHIGPNQGNRGASGGSEYTLYTILVHYKSAIILNILGKTGERPVMPQNGIADVNNYQHSGLKGTVSREF